MEKKEKKIKNIRLKNIRKEIHIDEKEDKIIKTKMKKTGFKNFSQYARKMLIDGYIIQVNCKDELREILNEIHKIGVNINQAVRIANTTQNISKEDINELAKSLDEVKDILKKEVVEPVCQS